jgi:hypothetical protein
MKARQAFWAWIVVALVGVFVVAVVAGLSLLPRLSAAQRVLDNGSPAFTNARVAGDRAGVTMISHAVDTLTPIVTPQGGAASEVPALVAYVSKQTGLSQPAVLAALTKNFPHTTALLEAIPLSSVTTEIPGLVNFLATTLHTTPAQVLAGLKVSYPDLYQSITNLPYVTNGWYNVPGTASLTTFSGTPVRTVPQVRDYFSQDVIPVLEDQKGNFQALAGNGGVGFIAPLLLTVGIVVIIFGVAMALFARKTMPRELAGAAWGVVVSVGVALVVVVLALSLFPRLDGGQNLLDQAQPAFSQARVAGDEASMTMVGHVIDFAAPAVNPQGGAASEVPALVASVSKQSGLSQPAVLGALTKNFPHATALLEAIPLSAVTSEIPGLVGFLGTALHLSDTQVLGALKANFPDLYQAVTNLPYVTGGWENIPGTAGLTDFSGAPVHTVPQMGAYLSGNVVPFLATERGDFNTVVSNWPRIPVFPPLLLVVGIIVILFGSAMLFLSVRRPRDKAAAEAPTAATAPPALVSG